MTNIMLEMMALVVTMMDAAARMRIVMASTAKLTIVALVNVAMLAYLKVQRWASSPSTIAIPSS